MIDNLPLMLHRSAVIYTYEESANKYKFLVILNKDCSNERIYYFSATTDKPRFFERYPHHPHIRIAKGDVSFFPDDTIIDCRWNDHYHIDRDVLTNRYKKGNIEFKCCGKLPEDIMSQIDEKIRNNTDIADNIKSLILP